MLVLVLLNILALIAVIIAVYFLRPKEMFLRISFSISGLVCLANLGIRYGRYSTRNENALKI